MYILLKNMIYKVAVELHTGTSSQQVKVMETSWVIKHYYQPGVNGQHFRKRCCLQLPHHDASCL